MCLYGDGGVSRSDVFDSFVTLWTVAHQAPLSTGILQARILEWGCQALLQVSSQLRDRTQVSRIVGRFFTI